MIKENAVSQIWVGLTVATIVFQNFDLGPGKVKNGIRVKMCKKTSNFAFLPKMNLASNWPYFAIETKKALCNIFIKLINSR